MTPLPKRLFPARRRLRLRPPRLRTLEAEDHRTATWLELFYDLAFVVAVAVLGQRLGTAQELLGVLSYLGYFFLVWWMWASHTFYADRYDTDDLVYRLLATTQLVAVAIIAASLAPGESGSTMAFAAGYTIARCALLVMYWRARHHVIETRALVSGYLVGFGVGAVLWAISIFVPDTARYTLWAVALTVDLATPWLMRGEQARAPLDVSHLPERFGLFTILILGESIAATVVGLSGHAWSPASLFAAVMALVIATAIWWLYFDNVEGLVVRRTAGVARTWRPTVWIYSHWGLAAGLGIMAIGLEHAIAAAGEGPFDEFETWVLVGGTALATLSLSLTHLASGDETTWAIHNRVAGARALSALGILALGLFGMTASGLVLGTAVILVGTAAIGVTRDA